MQRAQTFSQALWHNFLGNSPIWYKRTIICFLILNPVLMHTLGTTITGWVLIFEFIFTLALALKCYPLQPGGLLAIEAIIIGLASPEGVYHEVYSNLKVILLLIFMVAGIYFMKNLLLTVFTKLLVNVRSKTMLSLLFSLSAAFLSAFLDALTVTAVLISVSVGFYGVYHKAVSTGKNQAQESNRSYDPKNDDLIQEQSAIDLKNFRSFLRSLMMHGAVGTALGGVTTLVGEPQNLLIAEKANWQFLEFFIMMAPVTMPVLVIGILTCIFTEKFKLFGYGTKLPQSVRLVLEDYSKKVSAERPMRERAAIAIQLTAALILILSLAFHVAEVGLIGLMVIIILTAFNGVTNEHQIGKAFQESLPFTALLVVFFTIVTVIHEQHLFKPVIDWVFTLEKDIQPSIFFIANGLLSSISDNVFVATIYINEVRAAFDTGTIDKAHFDNLAIAINTGTNLPSVATPNGQAAFLFLLTSTIAPLIRLSYGTMVWMALPYAISMSIVGYFSVVYFL